MDYIIGSGAILETGEQGTITPASLHAHVDRALADRVQAVAVDFEGTDAAALKRLLILARGWNGAQFRTGVTERLRQQRECTLADVLRTLAQSAHTNEVHLFSHWLPDDATVAALQNDGIAVVAHPLESIHAASVVAGQRYRRWRAA